MKTKIACPLEYDECVLFANWLRAQNLRFTHIGNENSVKTRSPLAMAIARKKKAQGLAPGVPDYMIITPQGLVFVEMKRQHGSATSPEQKQWIEDLNKVDGVQAAICKGYQAARDFVTKFL